MWHVLVCRGGRGAEFAMLHPGCGLVAICWLAVVACIIRAVLIVLELN